MAGKGRSAMSEVDRDKAVRAVRAGLARFEAASGNGEDYVAMNHLLRAKYELDGLVRDLRASGYGQDAVGVVVPVEGGK
jgi:hypothetical protein